MSGNPRKAKKKNTQRKLNLINEVEGKENNVNKNK